MTHHPNLQDYNNKRSAEAARKREAGKTPQELGYTVWPTATAFLKDWALKKAEATHTSATEAVEKTQSLLDRLKAYFTPTKGV